MTKIESLDQLTPKDAQTFSEHDGHTGRGACIAPKDATHRDLIIHAGLDPDLWQISGRVNTRTWNALSKTGIETMHYYKFDVVAGESPESRQLHVDDLVKQIRRRTRKPSLTLSELPAQTFVFVVADWQVGKAEGNDGSEQTVERFRRGLDEAVKQIKGLRRMGVPIDDLAILSVGDLVEGCGDHYDIQTFTVDLDRRGQCKVVRELLTETILTLAPLFYNTKVVAVGGNHGENRKDGKSYTTLADNDDVATVEAVQEAFELAEWNSRRQDGGELTFEIAGSELSMITDLNGVSVGLTHGHTFRGGVNSLKKAEDWWRGQDFGGQATREARILLSGHFHSYHNANLVGGRTWIQAPTIDPGSAWFTNTSGITATRGVLTFVANEANPLGYDHLRILPVDV